MNGTDICFTIKATCGSGRPEFIINQQNYLFQDIYFNLSLTDFDIIYIPKEANICLRNIKTNIRFIEFCHLPSNCTVFQMSDDEEVTIETKIEIDVRSGRLFSLKIYYMHIMHSISNYRCWN